MRILILSSADRNIAVKAIMRAGKRRGHEMLVADPMHMNLLISDKSSGYDRIYLHKDGQLGRVNMKDIDALIPRIGQYVQYCSFIVDHLSNNLGIFSTQSSEGILNAANKLRTLQICSDAGLPTPRTIGLNMNSPIASLIEKLGGFPVVIKLLHGSVGQGVALLKDKVSAISTIQSLIKARTNILLQQYINSGGKDYRVIVLGSQVVASYLRNAPRGEFRANLQIGGQGSPVKLSDQDKSLCIRAAQAIGLKIAGVDIIKDQSGNTFLIEVNSNFGFAVEKITGIDVADHIIRFVETNYHDKPSQRNYFKTLQKDNQLLRSKLDPFYKNQYLAAAYKSAKGKQVSYTDRSSQRRRIMINQPEDFLVIMAETFQINTK